MIYIGNIEILTAKSAIYLGNVGYVALMVAAIGWAALMWWCFERNTDRLYASIRAMLAKAANTGRSA